VTHKTGKNWLLYHEETIAMRTLSINVSFNFWKSFQLH